MNPVPRAPTAMRRFPRLLLLLLLLASGCSELTSDGYDYGALDVRVLRRNGEPASGVRLVLYTWSHHLAYGETGADGRHTFAFVPPGDYGVRAVPEEPFVTFTGFASVSADGVEMDEGGREEVTFTLLKRGPGTVRVRVEDEGGAPVAGTEVFVYAYDGLVAEGVTGPSGEHEFAEVPFGDYGVRIEPTPGYVAEPGPGTSFVDGIRVDAGSLDVVDFTVARCTGRIRVRVADPSGEPVPGVRLSLYTFRGRVAEAVTDAAGAAEFPEAPCANLGVALQAGPGYTFEPGRGSSFVDDLTIARGTEREVSFVVTPGAGLVLHDSRGALSEGETGADGRFAFDPAPCGELGVRVVTPAGFRVQDGQGSSVFDAVGVEAGRERSVEFVLSRA